MLKSNFHTHTYRCKHAGGTEQDLVHCALLSQMTHLGFSEHAPYPDNRFGLRMDYSELVDYRDTIKALQKQYQDQLTIHLGLEIEYDPSQKDYYRFLKEDLGIEYLALGQHIYVSPASHDHFVNVYSLKTTHQYVEYAHTVCEAIKTGFFSSVAHPDVIFINDLPWDENCEKACDLIIDCAKEQQIILEFNANGIRRGLNTYCDGERYPYPHQRFWEKVSAANIPVLISSDCHHPSQLWDDVMEEAYHLAGTWHLNLVQTLSFF